MNVISVFKDSIEFYYNRESNTFYCENKELAKLLDLPSGSPIIAFCLKNKNYKRFIINAKTTSSGQKRKEKEVLTEEMIQEVITHCAFHKYPEYEKAKKMYRDSLTYDINEYLHDIFNVHLYRDLNDRILPLFQEEETPATVEPEDTRTMPMPVEVGLPKKLTISFDIDRDTDLFELLLTLYANGRSNLEIFETGIAEFSF